MMHEYSTVSSDDVSAEDEVSALVHQLHEIEQRIHVLTLGQVDAVLGPAGHAYMLRSAQQRLLASEAAQRRMAATQTAVLDALPANVALLDARGVILSVNEAWRRFAGEGTLPASNFGVGTDYPALCDAAVGEGAEDARIAARGLRAVLSGRQPAFSFEYLCHVGTQERWFRMLVAPLSKSQSDGAVVMHVDVSDRKHAEEATYRMSERLRKLNLQLEGRVLARTAELSEAREAAEHANLAKSSFLAAMSHEIRTPMNGVIGMVEVLRQTALDRHQVEMVDLVRDSAFSLLRIIDDILDLAKVEAGRMEIDRAPMRLGDMIESVCGLLSHVAVKAGGQLTAFIDPSIPPTLLGDEARLRQVLINLLGNAIKFSGGRDEPGRVAVRARLVGRHGSSATLELSVADNGIGMDEVMQSRLFMPFSQADVSTTRRFGGTGLGLAITHTLVGLMGGQISVSSAPGQGSEFVVRLELETPPAEPRLDPDLDLDLDAGRVAGLHCCLVGTDEPLGTDLAAYLAHAGVVVERAADADAAAALAASPTQLQLWLLLPSLPSEGLEALRERARSSRRGGGEARFIVLDGELSHRPRVEALDLLRIGVGGLSRRSLYRALAVVSGRLLAVDAVDERADVLPDTGFAPIQAAPAALAPHRVLVVEDNDVNRRVIEQQLLLIGFDAEFADNGLQALELWRSGGFALVLTDLHMPHMDGRALTAAIRSEEAGGRRTPIVALTANALHEEESNCLAAGMDAFLSKPVRLAHLKATLETQLQPAHTPSAAPAAAEAAASEQVVDLSLLEALVGNDMKVLDEVLETFRASAVRSAAALRRALDTSDLRAAADLAHKTKSGARSIGALTLGDRWEEIEASAHAGRADVLQTLLPRLEGELQTVLDFLDSR
jgi:signal transduction histidine kinase/CheY-like chemotaxis protein